MQTSQLIVSLIATTARSAGVLAQGDTSANWFCNPAIPPDGRSIAFVHAGDICLVDAAGGGTALLTVHKAFNSNPCDRPTGR